MKQARSWPRAAVPLRLLVPMVSLLACGPERQGVRLKGPLAAWTGRPVRPLGQCAVDSLAAPIAGTRAPYRRCVDSARAGQPFDEQSVTVSADTVAIEVRWARRVGARDRWRAFARAEREIARRLGPGVRCRPTVWNWRAPGGVAVALDLVPESSAGRPDSLPAEITRVARLGPQSGTHPWCPHPLDAAAR